MLILSVPAALRLRPSNEELRWGCFLSMKNELYSLLIYWPFLNRVCSSLSHRARSSSVRSFLLIAFSFLLRSLRLFYYIRIFSVLVCLP